jgi:hypothetical protein
LKCKPSKKPAWSRLCFLLASAGFLLAILFVAIYFSETSLDFYQATQRYIPEDKPHHRCKNFKSNNYYLLVMLLVILSECMVSINTNFWGKVFKARQPTDV